MSLAAIGGYGTENWTQAHYKQGDNSSQQQHTVVAAMQAPQMPLTRFFGFFSQQLELPKKPKRSFRTRNQQYSVSFIVDTHVLDSTPSPLTVLERRRCMRNGESRTHTVHCCVTTAVALARWSLAWLLATLQSRVVSGSESQYCTGTGNFKLKFVLNTGRCPLAGATGSGVELVLQNVREQALAIVAGNLKPTSKQTHTT
jgi:hypothetical protein